MRARPATIIVTARRGVAGPVIPIYRTPAGLDDGLTPVNGIDIEFGRPSPRDHSDPTNVTLTIFTPMDTDPLDIDYDDFLTVSAVIDGRPPVVLARAWVLGWQRTHQDRYARYSINGQDVTGRAAGTKIGAAPWPAQSSGARAAAINAAAGEQLLTVSGSGTFAGGDVAARDVDNKSVLDLAHLTAGYASQVHGNSSALLVEERNGGVTYAGGTMVRSRVISSPGVSDDSVIELPTGAVVDSGLVMSRGGRLTEISLTGYNNATDPEPATVRFYQPGGAAGPTSRHQVETDRDGLNVQLFGSNAGRWRGMLNASQGSRLSIPATELVMGRIPVGVLEALLDVDRRIVSAIHLAGPIRVPSTPPTHFITRGAITVRGGSIERYTLTLTPGDLAGVVALTWRHIQEFYPTETYAQQNRGFPLPSAAPTWGRTNAVQLIED